MRTPWNSQQLGGILLIVGTCIGAGMLALPLISACIGFLPSAVLFVICWLMMSLSALCIVEVNLTLPMGTSFISMAKHTLGRPGQYISWLAYLLLLYSLLAAYLSGGGDLASQILQSFGGVPLSSGLAAIPWIIIVGSFIFFGVRQVDLLNRYLVFGLFICLAALLVLMTPQVQWSRLQRLGDWRMVFGVLPVLMTAFGYHVVLPSVQNYVGQDSRSLVRVVLCGSAIPLIIYLCWNADVFGVVPLEGPQGLRSLLALGRPASTLPTVLTAALHSSLIGRCVTGFIFFAIASSFIGIALSLFDFLLDGVSWATTRWHRLLLVFVTLFPPWGYAVFYPQGFVLALRYAGVFVVVLNVLMPALMAAMIRWRGVITDHRLPGGWCSIILLLCFGLFVLGGV